MVEAGSGSLPTEAIKSRALVFNSSNIKPKELHRKFLKQTPSILGFIHNKKFRIDLKAILEKQTGFIQSAIKGIYN